MTLARRTEHEVTYAGVSITTDIAPYLLGLSYSDHLSGAADDLTLELQDRDGKWSGDWRPTFGDVIEARIKAEPWLTTVDDLRLGKFAHDKARFSGPPKRVSIKAVSAAMATGLRRQKRTKGWSGQTLQQIAQDIATRSGLSLLWSAPTLAAYKRREQKDQSDLEFLQRACKESGLSLKVTEGKIAIFEEHALEQLASVATIDWTAASSKIIDWAFDSQDHDRYGDCHVSCFDPASGKTILGVYADPDDSSGPTLEVTRAVSSQGEAERLAKALLRAANGDSTTGRIQIVGDLGLVAGVTIDIENSAGFDGKFIVTQADLRTTGGFTSTLQLRRTLESY